MLHGAQRAVALPQPFALHLERMLRRLPRHRLLGLRRRPLRRRRRRERRLQLLLKLKHLPPFADGDTDAAGGERRRRGGGGGGVGGGEAEVSGAELGEEEGAADVRLAQLGLSLIHI